jgi:hypothetical protein
VSLLKANHLKDYHGRRSEGGKREGGTIGGLRDRGMPYIIKLLLYTPYTSPNPSIIRDLIKITIYKVI